MIQFKKIIAEKISKVTNIKSEELESIANLCTSSNILANPYKLNKEEILKLLQSIY